MLGTRFPECKSVPIKREYLDLHIVTRQGWKIEKLWVQIGLNSDDIVKQKGLGLVATQGSVDFFPCCVIHICLVFLFSLGVRLGCGGVCV